jgi:hypothetical protein
MAILTGFPPSNTISPGPRIPCAIKETTVEIGSLKEESRFRLGENEYFLLKRIYPGSPRALCYKGSDVGQIMGFSLDKEVIWLENTYPKPLRENVWLSLEELDWREICESGNSILVFGSRENLVNEFFNTKDLFDYYSGYIATLSEERVVLDSLAHGGVSFLFSKIKKIMVLNCDEGL